MNNGFKAGSLNFSWKGDNVKHSGIHCWVRDNWGKPNLCEHCGTTSAKVYDWSNKDHLYSRKREDWQRLCRSCHNKYDNKTFNMRQKKRNKVIYEFCVSCNRAGLVTKAKGMCSRCYQNQLK